jgi:hypothetical protein
MVSYVMEGRRGRRSLLALLVALTVATVGVYVMATATTAQAAKAATGTTCNPYAKAPFLSTASDGTRYVNFRTTVICSAPIQAIGIKAYGTQYYSGSWHGVAYRSARVDGKSSASLTARVKCTRPYTPYSFGTTNQESWVMNNGSSRYLRTVYSGVVSLNC